MARNACSVAGAQRQAQACGALPELDSGVLCGSVGHACESGRTDWVEVPKDGQKLSDLKSPAALLEVLPAAGGGHSH